MHDREIVALARRMIECYGGDAQNVAIRWAREARSEQDERTERKWHLVVFAMTELERWRDGSIVARERRRRIV